MRYYLDTNIFLRLLIKDQPRQYTHCVTLIKAVKENKISAFTGTTTLAEIAWTLSSYYKFSKADVIRATRSIIHLAGLTIYDSHNHLLALNLYEKYSVKFIDALIASSEEIQNKQVTIVSYDKDFDKLSIICQEPYEVLKAS